VSSILPPNCERIERENGLDLLEAGQIVHCVMSVNQSNVIDDKILASIGIAVPKEKHHGYIAEYHSTNQDDKIANERAEEMAAIMLATTLGLDFNEDKEFKEIRESLLNGGKIQNIECSTSSAVVKKGWYCVLAAVVFIL
ncbi:MAG: pyruvoyl-dependent arginine decarboxylase, partial [Candidatus Helarchaeota archaeon]